MNADWDWMLAGMGRVWAPVASPLGLFLALMVTGHILLRKRDVAACMGWIGLVWIAPGWGALIYYFFGINRVVRRARQVRDPRPPRQRTSQHADPDFAGHLKPLERAIRNVTRRPMEARNGITTLRHGDAAYPAMLAAIAAARQSIALSTFIMRHDAVGQAFVDALVAAQARGVAVRVLLDGVGSGYFPAIDRVMRRRGLQTALFMHSALPWRMPFLNLRNHRKLLIVDGAVGFTGGINIGADNVLAGQPRHPVADTHFRLEGPVVAQMADAFAHDWSFAMGEQLDGPAWFPDPAGGGGAAARVISSGPDQDLAKIQLVLLEAIGCAATSIRIMTPYFLPQDEVLTALSLAALRGVDVELVVPRRSNHRVVDLAMRAHIGPLLDHGTRVWLSGAPFNHSKLMVVDSHWCLVGSANWDMRSLRLNFELNVEIYDTALARELETLMASHHQRRLRPHDLWSRSLPVRLRDAAIRLTLPYI